MRRKSKRWCIWVPQQVKLNLRPIQRARQSMIPNQMNPRKPKKSKSKIINENIKVIKEL